MQDVRKGVKVLDAVLKPDCGFPDRFAGFENKNDRSQTLHRRESYLSGVAAVVVRVGGGEEGTR